MKKIILSLVTLVLVIGFAGCNSPEKSSGKQVETLASGDVAVYYFHGVRRCVTCVAVGDIAKSVVKNHYADDSHVQFVEVNFDEPGNESLVEQFQVTGSSLYISNGNRSTNLTALAFQSAKADPEKLQAKLIDEIDKMLR